jgi:hypothetical protein
LRLHREGPAGKGVAAIVVYWDSAGQFFFETVNGDVPLNIVESLIAEAKDAIKLK